MKDKTNIRSVWISLVIFVLLVGTAYRSSKAAAAIQGTEDTEWSVPRNLSQSGGASSPRMVIDTAGRVNLLWLDRYSGAVGEAGLMAAQGINGEWSKPALMAMPFGKYMDSLKLAAAPNGWIYAGWIDDQGILYASQVRGEAFSQPGNWTLPEVLTYGVADFDLATASDNNAHFVYIRATDSADYPAGVYALRMIGAGTMTAPRMLAASPYFRGLTADEVEISAAAGNSNVYAAWELPDREQIFAAVSSNDGMNWSEARLVDSRKPEDGSGTRPGQPRLQALEDPQPGTALLVWQAGHQGVSCAQYSQYSVDGGQTWSDAAVLPEPFGKSCAQELALMKIPDGGILGFAETASGVNLLAWEPNAGQNGWSNPQAQSALSGFTDPVTYRATSLGCIQGGVSPAGMLSVTGCESEAAAPGDKSGDIWLLERALGNLADWFPAPPAEPLWSPAVILDSSTQRLYTPALVDDPSGRLHGLWSWQADPGLYYAQWDGSRWTQVQAVLDSPGGSPQQIAALTHPNGIALAVWNDPAAGGLFYSLATAAQASEAANWLAPQDLPLSGYPSSPQIVTMADGRIALAYVQAYNEGRGIYLLKSKAPPQAGQIIEWGKPEVIFAADQAEWDSLGDLRLVLTGDGDLAAMWTRYSLPPESRPSGLYSAQELAGDEGSTWSEPEEVRLGQVVWSAMMANGSQLHRSWQELLGGRLALFHQASLDNGKTWSSPVRPGGANTADGQAGQQPGLVGLALTPRGELNLVQISPQSQAAASGTTARQSLVRWEWQADPPPGGAWTKLESQELSGLEQVESLSVTGERQGLMALFSGVETAGEAANSAGGPTQTDQANDISIMNVYASHRTLPGGSGPAGQPGGTAAGAATATPGESSQAEQPTAAATPTSGPTPTATFNPNPASGGLPGLGGMSGALIIGLAASMVIAGLAFLLVGRNRRRWERDHRRTF